MTLEIKEINISETWNAPNWPEILDEYSCEASIPGLPTPKPNIDLYKKYDALGMLHVFGAFLDATLIGYITIIEVPATHYSSDNLVSTESFFVQREYRHTGAGLKLLRKAEEKAKALKAGGLLVSARSGSNLATVLDRCAYEETNRVFFKRFANE